MAAFDWPLLERLFRAFDRLTAYRCRQRGVPYDREACREAWDAYAAADPTLSCVPMAF